MAKRKLKASDVQPVVDDISMAMRTTPRMSSYYVSCVDRKVYVKRPAKFAPELLAEGLSSGIIQSSNTLMHGEFDDADATGVDPIANIASDKFAMMQSNMSMPNFDAGGSEVSD